MVGSGNHFCSIIKTDFTLKGEKMKSVRSFCRKYSISRLEVYDHFVESIRSLGKYSISRLKVGTINTLKIYDLVNSVNDLVLFTNDRILSIKVMYFQRLKLSLDRIL